MGDVLTVACFTGVIFILGCWYGLYLNLSHMHRMRLWAEKVATLLDEAQRKEMMK